MRNAFLRYAVSAAALLTGMVHNAAARLRIERDARPTPRKPERAKVVSKAHPRRAMSRQDAQKRFDRQMRKEREIGIDPIFQNGDRAARERLSAEWRKQSREWDRVNG